MYLVLLLSLTALLRPLSAHNGAVAIAVPVEGAHLAAYMGGSVVRDNTDNSRASSRK